MKEKIKLIEEFLMENFPHLFRLVTTDDIETWIKEKEVERLKKQISDNTKLAVDLNKGYQKSKEEINQLKQENKELIAGIDYLGGMLNILALSNNIKQEDYNALSGKIKQLLTKTKKDER